MLKAIALQLYTIRDELAKDFDGAIRKVAAMGYAGVETAGFPGTTPAAAARLFKELGLEAMGAHSPLPLGDKKAEVLDTMAALGCKRVIAPYIPKEEYQTIDQIRRNCDKLNEADDVARASGLTLLYHNHWWEYQKAEGRYAYQVMLEHLAPTVGLEVDTY